MLLQSHSKGCASSLFERRDDSSDSETDSEKNGSSLFVPLERTSAKVKDEAKLERGNTALVEQSQLYEDAGGFVSCRSSLEKDVAFARRSQRLRPLNPTVEVW